MEGDRAADTLIQTKASGTGDGLGQRAQIGHKFKRVTHGKPKSCQEKKNVLVRDEPARSGGHTRAPEVSPYPAIAFGGWKEGRPAAFLA